MAWTRSGSESRDIEALFREIQGQILERDHAVEIHLTFSVERLPTLEGWCGRFKSRVRGSLAEVEALNSVRPVNGTCR